MASAESLDRMTDSFIDGLFESTRSAFVNSGEQVDSKADSNETWLNCMFDAIESDISELDDMDVEHFTASAFKEFTRERFLQRLHDIGMRIRMENGSNESKA